MTVSRRDVLKGSLLAVGTMGATSALGRMSDVCSITPAQPEGPFYPVRDQRDKNNDLTVVEGRRSQALGEIIYIHGVVSDSNCTPIKGAVVEIWQACATGRYNHPGDQDNANSLDPNFQYWGISSTNEKGEYWFKTILPGHYSAAPNWIRPPHVHFKVHMRGFLELTTQMYFQGNQYNEADLILRRIPDSEKNSVVVPMLARPDGKGHNCRFDISLVPVT